MSAELKARLLRRARELGACAMRVVDAGADAVTQERLGAAIARGDLATWRFDAAYARGAADPGALLPGARSVVCIAVPYATQDAPRRTHLEGRISNYAWSRNYHRRLIDLLKALAAEIDAAAGANVTAVACDTKPIAERAFAARAGLGWVGKHTNLIEPEFGSFVFLGEIVTSIALEPDEPLRKSCGSCARCVEVCPTGALRGDYTIDATRCIADLTQRTDPIPRAMRPLIGDWIWGCDLCQLACPPTKSAGSRGESAYAPMSAESAAPRLTELLQLRHGEFNRRFRKTAIGWRGLAVLRRNAAIGLGNALDRSAIPALARTLNEDPHPMVRGAAAWALGRIGAPDARAALHERIAVESDPHVTEEIAAALA